MYNKDVVTVIDSDEGGQSEYMYFGRGGIERVRQFLSWILETVITTASSISYITGFK